jgi:formylglycine-generating enzyme required for sulfatase activity
LRDGTDLAGALAAQEFELRTVYGTLRLPADRIAAIEPGSTAEGLDVLLGVNGDRFSGLLDPSAFVVRLAPGSVTNLKAQSVAKLMRSAPVLVTNAVPGRPILRLRNGDRFAVTPIEKTLPVKLDRTNQGVNAGEIDTVHFPREHSGSVRLLLRNGETLLGTWATENVEVELELGPRLGIHFSRLESIHFRAGAVAHSSAGLGLDPQVLPDSGRLGSPRQIPGMVWVQPGRFTMGSPVEESGRDLDEGPLTEVTLTRGFWMAIHEVTQAEYKAVVGANPSQFVEDNRAPVERVSWREATNYCHLLNAQRGDLPGVPDGYVYRLPTEAEWEYACRAGTRSRFSHGDDEDGGRLQEFAWFSENADSTTHPVGTREPNPWGLHDLHGNVMEWCLDTAGSSLPGGSVADYRSSERGLLRSARGGSWLYSPKFCRSANRDSYTETTRCSDLGFRAVLGPVLERR